MAFRRLCYIAVFACVCLLSGCPNRLRDDSVVRLQSPANLACTNQVCPCFSWVPVPNASYYVLTIATDEAMTGQALERSVSNAEYTLQAAESLGPSPSQQYYWNVCAYDSEDKPLGDSAQFTFYLDTVAPTVIVTINDGDATTSLESLQIGCQVSDSTSCPEMRACFDDNFDSLSWEQFAALKNVTAADYALVGTATMTAFVQVKDAAGNPSATAADSIELKRTLVSGVITSNTVWGKAGSPYIIKGNTAVDANRILTIEPGVEVLFDGAYYLKIEYLMTAIGTASERILFSNTGKAGPASWDTIYFSPSCLDAGLDPDGNYAGGCSLQYCTIEYGGVGNNHFGVIYENGAVIAASSSPYINNCIIRNNRQGVYGPFRILENCYLHDNSLYGVCNGGPLVRNNRVERNGGGIYQPTGQVTKNDIEKNTGFGIYLSSTLGGSVTYNRIVNNSWEGIYNYWGGAVINYNDIYGNGDYQYTKIDFHDIYSDPGVNQPDDNAIDNYWGTSSQSEIEAAVYDYHDTAGSCGKVTYIPFETSAVSGAGATLPPL